jgi:hypothetical protein
MGEPAEAPLSMEPLARDIASRRRNNENRLPIAPRAGFKKPNVQLIDSINKVYAQPPENAQDRNWHDFSYSG